MKIRDKFKHHLPLDSIDLKHIKGQTIIELRDAKSGKLVQRTKDDNMLTKALEYFYAQGGLSNPTAFGASGIRTDALTYLLGGVLCLDTALTESDTIVRVPAGVGMTANGAKGVLNTGNPPELGSWNENESGWMQDGSYKTVYDWTTSQGNGTIACVCLASHFMGKSGIGNKSETAIENSYSMSDYNSYFYKNSPPNAIGYKENSFLTADIIGVTEWTVNEYAYPTSAIDVRDNASTYRLIGTKTVQIPNDIKNLSGEYGNTWARIAKYQHGNVMSMILMRAFHNFSSSYTMYYFTDASPVFVVRYNVVTDAVEVIKLCPSTTGLEAFETTDYPAIGISQNKAIVGKYAFDLSNLVNVTEIEDMDGENYDYQTEGMFASPTKWVDLSNNTARLINYKGGQGYLRAERHINPLLGQNAQYIFRDPRYIASINNLESPVTKDASKTMKVTYVLRFDVQEGE